jgi:hypothetical protein
MAFSASLSSAHQIKRLGRHHKKSSPATAACSGSGSGSGSGSATPTVEPARLGGTRWLSRGAPPPAASEREVLTLALDHFVLFVASCAARLYHPYTTRGSNPGLADPPPPLPGQDLFGYSDVCAPPWDSQAALQSRARADALLLHRRHVRQGAHPAVGSTARAHCRAATAASRRCRPCAAWTDPCGRGTVGARLSKPAPKRPTPQS